MNRLKLEILACGVESVNADALLLPVDGQVCKLGGGAVNGLRLALPADERIDELSYIEDQLAQLRPLANADARLVEGIACWKWMLVSAAYPHNVDGKIYTPDECALMVRHAIPAALAVLEHAGLESVAATLIGTAYRMSHELAVRAFADGLAAAATRDVVVRWSLPHAATRQLAEMAAQRLGIRVVKPDPSH